MIKMFLTNCLLYFYSLLLFLLMFLPHIYLFYNLCHANYNQLLSVAYHLIRKITYIPSFYKFLKNNKKKILYIYFSWINSQSYRKVRFVHILPYRFVSFFVCIIYKNVCSLFWMKDDLYLLFFKLKKYIVEEFLNKKIYIFSNKKCWDIDIIKLTNLYKLHYIHKIYFQPHTNDIGSYFYIGRGYCFINLNINE